MKTKGIRRRDKRIIVAIAMSILLIAAFFSNVEVINGVYPFFFGLVRSGIYLLMIMIWSITVKERVIQRNIQNYLIFICFLMFLWISFRIYKYEFSSNLKQQRMLWYWYYFPMIFIPLLSLFATISLGKGENYRLKASYNLLFIPAILLLALTLTNDIHQFVFVFPSKDISSNDIYIRNWGYYLIVFWIVVELTIVVILLVKKCRIKQRKKLIILPIIPLILCGIYGVLYWFDISWFQLYLGDMTVVFCILIGLTAEACIQSRLIPSNIGYEEIFQANSLKTMICDDNLQVEVKSDNAKKLSIDDLRASVESVHYIDENTILKSHRIKDGYVFWQEDVSQIVKEVEMLKQTQTELEDIGDIIAEENRQKNLMAKIIEERRLYDLIERETKDQIAKMNYYIDLLKHTEDLDKAKKILGNIVFIGTYIKRKSNLLLVKAQKTTIEPLELQLCFNESLANLELAQVQCIANFSLISSLTAEEAFKLYDIFEECIEMSLDSVKSVLVYIGEKKQYIEMKISIACLEDLTLMKMKYSDLEVNKDEDGLYYLSIQLAKEEDYE